MGFCLVWNLKDLNVQHWAVILWIRGGIECLGHMPYCVSHKLQTNCELHFVHTFVWMFEMTKARQVYAVSLKPEQTRKIHLFTPMENSAFSFKMHSPVKWHWLVFSYLFFKEVLKQRKMSPMGPDQLCAWQWPRSHLPTKRFAEQVLGELNTVVSILPSFKSQLHQLSLISLTITLL